MSVALYRKYRSRKLADIVGQDHITDILVRSLKKGRVAHAYLFTGPRGVGKTSIARILAHEINELPYSEDSTHLDIIEIDAASNNGVDDIRDLRDKVSLAPVKAKKKVYIIDEVHMLSKPAFNALLKTLEEPPEHVVFILATTDVEKLPDTIISRTQRHNFKRASIDDLVKNLKTIVKKEKLSIEPATLELIAQHSDGSFRDSVSLLDQIANMAEDGQEISAADVEHNLGLAGASTIAKLLEDTIEHRLPDVTSSLNSLEATGIQARVIAAQLIDLLRSDPVRYASHLDLLDGLLGVASSSLPAVKLLAVLGGYAVPTTKSAAQVATTTRPTVIAEAPIKELERAALKPHPAEPTREVPAAPAKPAPQATGTPRGTLDEAQLIEFIKQRSVALMSLLTKCGFETTKNGLTIYAKTAFYKKKLDTSRYQQLLYEALENQSCQNWEITTVATAKPSDNKHISAIAAIMGGGEEVTVE